MNLELLWALPAFIGLVLIAIFRYAQGRLLSAPPPPPLESAPGITILKPMKGVDDGLEKNLRSFFGQTYPTFEILLGSPQADDPALDVARRVAAEFPAVDARVFVESQVVCLNPKMNLLAGLSRHARHGIWLISDSNVEADPGYLKDLAAHLHRPGVGLVSSLFRGSGWRGLGGALESLQLNTFVMGGVSAAHLLMNIPCVVGKSMLFRREDLEAIGGFEFLGKHLAEDQVCGEEMARRGRGVVVSGRLIDNVLGAKTLAQFLDRHLRWCRIRRRISFPGYVGEFFLNPAILAAAAWGIVRTMPMGIVFGAVWLAASMIAASAERRAGIRRPLAVYPVLELVREFLAAAVWVVPFVNSTVSWRGDRLKVGPRTRLIPLSKSS